MCLSLPQGAEPLRLSLFLDIVTAMLPGSAETFLDKSKLAPLHAKDSRCCGQPSAHSLGHSAPGGSELHKRARKELLSAFRGTAVRPIVVTGVSIGCVCA